MGQFVMAIYSPDPELHANAIAIAMPTPLPLLALPFHTIDLTHVVLTSRNFEGVADSRGGKSSREGKESRRRSIPYLPWALFSCEVGNNGQHNHIQIISDNTFYLPPPS